MLVYTDKKQNLIVNTSDEDVRLLSDKLYDSLTSYQHKYEFKLSSEIDNTYIVNIKEVFKGLDINLFYIVNHSVTLECEFIQIQLVLDNKKYSYETHGSFDSSTPDHIKATIYIILKNILFILKGDIQ